MVKIFVLILYISKVYRLDEMIDLLDVVKVSPQNGYVLSLEFENGECRLFDMSSIPLK